MTSAASWPSRRREHTQVSKSLRAMLRNGATDEQLQDLMHGERRRQVERWNGVPGTFLVEGECSIHRYRPIICRQHISMDRDSLLCESAPPEHNDTISVPYSTRSKSSSSTPSRSSRAR